ncbi:hypothetical protein OIE13_17030 [Streptosporangium sp. NBC_01810]|uniref:hypothetical protein n=1 Tax=Streptosporangium sp. NBC_01810 TaxID=2975951 RepID=UPI002DD8EDE9|nr:hypothetical protein [Streptosporangium sp. NBC_01810]WSA29431.1 hypothetical protein OIE13_17030 [Streptosporangium sp. NBC_01810]
MTKTKTPADPDLTMTEAEVDAIVGDALADAERAARAVEQAEAMARGEAPSAGLAMKAADVTPARLVELRAAVDLAQMRVSAAERRTEEVREKRKHAEWETIRARIREEAAGDLDGSADIVAALDTFEAALRGLCETLQEHNDRVTRWSRMIGSAGIAPTHGEQAGPEGFSREISNGSVTIDRKVYRPLVAGKFVGATIFRVMSPYPRPFLKCYIDQEVTDKGDWYEGTASRPVDLRATIRRDA